ncbi:50S ribosomal protein L32 [Kutzneria kofuensis]|uniref:Large ribosomal subunit protein bL32 n=1 Tax=Kutzneria kofuensis TaxID=103725 RepID=A0A7W9KG50_9PSEU|nr:50S ribosomal protein L32 [Kutzneria kofuensis]MBB5891989.1 large subunit ribosomal protein L32 [Kutzneria kofuensis]
MAVPKRRTSRSNTRHRRSQWKATAPELVPIVLEGRRILVPRHLVPAYHRGFLRPRQQ